LETPPIIDARPPLVGDGGASLLELGDTGSVESRRGAKLETRPAEEFAKAASPSNVART